MMLEGKTAVITGAARGIGLACAERFVKEGAKVVLADVMDDVGEVAAKRLNESGGDVRYRACDVTDKAQVDALIKFAQETFGRLDCVIANAGIVHTSDILDLEEADFDRVIAVNLKGVFLTGQSAARVMRDQALDEDGSRGTIINMSSLNAVVAIPAIAP